MSFIKCIDDDSFHGNGKHGEEASLYPIQRSNAAAAIKDGFFEKYGFTVVENAAGRCVLKRITRGEHTCKVSFALSSLVKCWEGKMADVGDKYSGLIQVNQASSRTRQKKTKTTA